MRWDSYRTSNMDQPHNFSICSGITVGGIYANQSLTVVRFGNDMLVDLPRVNWSSISALGEFVAKIASYMLNDVDAIHRACLHDVGDGTHVNPGISLFHSENVVIEEEQRERLVLAVVRFLQGVVRDSKYDPNTKQADEALLCVETQSFIQDLIRNFLELNGGNVIGHEIRVVIFEECVALVPPGRFAPKPRVNATPGEDFEIKGSFRALDLDARRVGVRPSDGRGGKITLQFDEENNLDVLRERLGDGNSYVVTVRQELLANGTLANVVSRMAPVDATNDDPDRDPDLFSEDRS